MIDAPGSNVVSNLFDQGHTYDAAGDLNAATNRAVLWSGCSDTSD